MYLVLTAMLALNVDKQVLDAFEKVDKSFVETISNVNDQNKLFYEGFQSKMMDNQQKYQESFNKAAKVKVSSDSLCNYITQLKELLVKSVDGPEGKIDSIVSKSDLNITPVLMITQKNGDKLKAAIDNYRNNLVAFVDPSNKDLINSINKTFDTRDPKPSGGNTPTWVTDKFEGYPLIAVITLMSKIQSDVRNTESDVVGYLAGKEDAKAFKISDLKAMVVPSTSDYVLSGSSYEAKIFLGAVDKTIVPEVYVGNSRLIYDPLQSAAIYKINPTTIGKTEFNGRIEYRDPTGELKSFTFNHEYEVGRPTMTVSPTKMNVLYAGVDNPVSISVPGVSSKDLKVYYKGNLLMPNDTGIFIINPPFNDNPKEQVELGVNAMVNGVQKEIGKQKFRLKKFPNPIPGVKTGTYNRLSGDITKLDIVNGEIIAVLEDLDWEVKYVINSFVMTIFVGDQFKLFQSKRNNPLLTQEQKDLIMRLGSGSRIIIGQIEVTGPDKRPRTLDNNLVFRLK